MLHNFNMSGKAQQYCVSRLFCTKTENVTLAIYYQN